MGEDLPLESQINYWLNFISEDVRLSIMKINTTNYNLNFEFYNGSNWDSFSTENSAFGLTYSLPVVTSLLAASPGDIVIIENPESDLHPKAQSKLGELIVRCANEGYKY
ncbi:MAG: AAA family ATPase [Chitinophagaceae bacterium]|nr:AAA family ATPase [Chitinophagaceae bacterium]